MTNKTIQTILADTRFKAYARSLLPKDEINFFRILSVDGYEIRHSNFLAWLLDPKGSHRLGAEFLSDFISHVTQGRRNYANMALEKTVIYREKDHFDLLLLNDAESLLVCIENKVGSPEGYKQLQSYRRHIENPKSPYSRYRFKVFVYLTLPDTAPSSDEGNWQRLSYVEVAVILQKLRSRSKDRLVTTIIDMYLAVVDDLLADHLGGSSLAYQIYSDYKGLFRKVAKKSIVPPKLKSSEKKAFEILVNMVERDDVSLITGIYKQLANYPTIEATKRTNAIYFNSSRLRKLRKTLGLEGHLLYCFVTFPHALVFQMYLHPATTANRTKWNALRNWLQSNPISEQVFNNQYGYFTFFEIPLLDLASPLINNKPAVARLLSEQTDKIIEITLPMLEDHIEKYVSLIRPTQRKKSW